MSGSIDTNLYSRQIGTYGMETMGKLIQMKVLISGLRGLGVEIAKNLILAGPAKVVLHDDAAIEIRDLGANFYLTEEDIKMKRTRAEACQSQLAELNPYVTVEIHKGAITKELVSNLSVVVLTESSQSEILSLNKLCRSSSSPVGFISTSCLGLAASVFVDFGDTFTCRDKDGEEPRSAIVSGITLESPGTVHTHQDRRHGFQDGDFVVFREVQGMTQLNDGKPRQIKVTGPFSFTIEDTSGYTAYISDGIVTQTKVAHTINFSSYEDSLAKPKHTGEEMHVPDMAKFGRSEQLHFAVQAVMAYREKHGNLPAVRDAAAAEECVQLAKEINEKRKTAGDAAMSVEEIESDIVKKVSMFARSVICPMAAFLGGVVAQEVVKFTGKFTPLHQFLYFDMFELCPPSEPADWKPVGSRYDDQISIFGASFQQELANMKLFLVGAGALGCEYLKSLALMGVGCGGGKVTVTDMDRIEISNLNRQFLFRQSDVGHSKSLAASRAAKAMNKDLTIESMEVRVGPDTEDVFDDPFWDSLHCIVNALDNIQARLYVDSRCVWFGKPLLESGTLGTKANMQVVLPKMTQSYGDSQDPPEESIPLCTVKHFPNAIEHTIEWSREAFEQMFVEAPREGNSFLGDPATYLQKLPSTGSGTAQLQRLKSIKHMMEKRSGPFQSCVEYAVLEFQEKFHDSIAQLLYTFPLDHVTSEGTKFWSGPKRPPAPIKFDASDKLHMDFIMAAANLYAATLGMPQNRDHAQLASMAAAVQVQEFKPKEMKIKVDDKDTTGEGCMDDDEIVRHMTSEMSEKVKSLKSKADLQPAEFEKDDDSNFHIQFIAAAANLRARNYKIPEADFHKVKMTAGKIIPAIATTTAMITGLVSAELLKVVKLESRKVEDFKDAFVSLALPLWVLSEPLPPVKTVSKEHDPIVMGPVKARPEGFTSWDKVECNLGDATLQEFLDFLTEEMSVEVMIMSSGNACLYNAYVPAHKKRLKEKITSIWETITKQQLSPKKSYLTLEVSASDLDDGQDVVIPTVKFQFR